MTTIRPMRPDDISEKALVHAATWQETYANMLPDELNARITPSFAEDVTRRLADVHTLVALDEEKIVGYVSYLDTCRESFGQADALEICNLYVLASHKGRGFGRALLESALQTAETRDAVLSVFSANAPAIEFYRHMGFRPTGRRFGEGQTEELEMVFERK